MPLLQIKNFFIIVEVKLYSLEQYIGLIEDKLSSTTVDFFRSEGYLETKCLYWNRSLRSAKSVKTTIK